jgi:hypothetical protein
MVSLMPAVVALLLWTRMEMMTRLQANLAPCMCARSSHHLNQARPLTAVLGTVFGASDAWQISALIIQKWMMLRTMLWTMPRLTVLTYRPWPQLKMVGVQLKKNP